MKVIHFITAIDRSLGGVSLYMQLLTKELGKKVDLLVVTRPTPNPLQLENCRIIYLPFPLSEIYSFKKQWRKILKMEKPNIVHINGIWMMQTWIIQKEAIQLGIKTYITPHGMLEPWILNRNPLKKKLALFLYQKKALKSALALISTAESEKENILKLQMNPNVYTIPNGIDISEINLKNNWNVKKKILYLSRVHVKKGVELLIDSVVELEHELKGYEIIIAGEGEQAYLAQLIEKSEAIKNNSIKFVGGIYGNEKWNLYQDADFFVLPTHSENFGYVIAESLATGTPVITTKGAPWQDLEERNCGFWIERDKESLKDAIRKMIKLDNVQLRRMGISGRKLIEEKFSAVSVANSIFNIYNTL